MSVKKETDTLGLTVSTWVKTDKMPNLAPLTVNPR